MANRTCQTCKHFEPSPIRRMGWCRNPLLYSPQQSHLVDRDDLDCGHRLGNYWEPAESLDGSEPMPAGTEDTPEAVPLRLMMTEPHPVPAAAGLVARSSSGGNPLSSGGGSSGGGRPTGGGSGSGVPPLSGRPGGSGRGGPPGPERSVSYQPEERYWTDYLRIALPAIGLVLMLGLFWYWASALIGEDNNGGGTQVAAGSTATATAPSGNGLGTAGQPTATPTPSLPEELTETPAERPTRTPRSASAETPTPEKSDGGFAEGDEVVTTEVVNLRSEPALDENNVITTLDAGTHLTVTGAAETADGNDWVPVITDDGEEGYVSGAYLEPA